jgi:hypothetical protein
MAMGNREAWPYEVQTVRCRRRQTTHGTALHSRQRIGGIRTMDARYMRSRSREAPLYALKLDRRVCCW